MSKTILLADDSVTIQKVIELTFMDQDYELVAVSTGDEALEQLDQLSPDIVIADVHMPGANGYEVARRSKDLRPGVPVLLLVGTFETFDEGEMAASGADSHLKKPFDSTELHQLVESLLDSAGEAAAPMPEPTPTPVAAEPAGPEPVSPEPVSLGGESVPEPVWDNLDLGAEETPTALSEASAPTAEPEPFQLETPAAEPEPFELETPAVESEPFQWEAPTAEPEPLRLEEDEEPQPFVLEEEEEEAAGAAPGSASDSLEETHPDTPPRLAEAVHERPAAGFAAPDAEAAEPEPASAAATGLAEEDVERIARRVAELIGDQVVRDVAWEVIPDLAEVVIKNRIRELESQVE